MKNQSVDRLGGPILRAAFHGACWSSPFAVFTSWQCIRHSKKLTDTGSVLTGVAVVLVWAAIAAFATRQRWLAKPSRRDAVIREEVRRAARTAAMLSAPFALFFVVVNWGYNPGAALMGAAMVQAIWVGSATGVGYLRGRRKAREVSEDSATVPLE